MNGVVVYLLDSIALLSKKHQVVLFAPGDSNKLVVEKKSKTFKIVWIPASPFPFYEGYRVASMNYTRVSDLIRNEQPDIVHAHAPINLGLQGIIAAKRQNIPTVITYHTHFPDYVPHLMKGKLPSIFNNAAKFTAKKFVKYTFRYADIITAPTEELATELRSYGLTNVTYLPNGVQFSKLKSTREKANRFRTIHNIPDNKNNKIVIYLGRISFEKKLDTMLEAFAQVKEHSTLVIAGGGPYLDRFEEIARGLGITNVRFVGFIDNSDVGSAYSCGSIFVSASDTETFGLTFVEAMYQGLPVIGVDKLGAKEIIENGKSGILVKPDDPKAMAAAIEKLVSDDKLRKRMGAEARKRAKKYSIEKSVTKTLAIYSKLLAGRKTRLKDG